MVDHQGYLLSTPHHKRREFRKSVTKYTRRGWKLRGLDWPAERRFSNLPVHNSRRVGDRLSWIIPFDTESVEHSKTPDHVLEYADFTIRTDPVRRGNLKYFLVEFSPYAATGLKCSYTFGHKHWMTYLESKLAAKMHENPRHDRLGNVGPAWDNCWDDYIPDFYLAWRQSMSTGTSAAVQPSSKAPDKIRLHPVT